MKKHVKINVETRGEPFFSRFCNSGVCIAQKSTAGSDHRYVAKIKKKTTASVRWSTCEEEKSTLLWRMFEAFYENGLSKEQFQVELHKAIQEDNVDELRFLLAENLYGIYSVVLVYTVQ